MKDNLSLSVLGLEYRVYANGSGAKAAAELNKELGEWWWVLNAESILNEVEPAVGAREAVLDFKLRTGEVIYHQLAQNPQFSGAILKLMATDVTFFDPEGKETHQLARGEFDQEAEIERLANSFELQAGRAEVKASWILVVGLITWFLNEAGQPTSSQKKIVELELGVSFSKPPTKAEIAETFNPRLSPGFDVVNLATPDRASFTLKGTNEEVGYPVDQSLAQLLIEKKIPPQAIYHALLIEEGEVVERGDKEAYQLISVSLLGLT